MAARPSRRKPKTGQPGETYNLSGDFRHATINIQSTIVGAAEVRDIEQMPPEPGEPPYKGLQYFTQADADHFFGRERLTARVVNRLAASRFLAVLGASGSGKSSLVRAGLLPALQRGVLLADGTPPPANSARWLVRLLTPGARPFHALAAALASGSEALAALAQELAAGPEGLALTARRLLAGADSPRLLLVVDQFEEVFTQCHNEDERRAFIAALLSASAEPEQHPVSVVVALRADFYDALDRYDALRERVADQQVYIGPMGRDELFDAIVKPAALGGWKIQEGLVQVMLDDVGSEPGALPLLSHALLETWNRRRGRTMTLSAYQESGGVRGAIARTAEAVFQQRLTPQQQGIARLIFTRLVGLENDARDTRRRATFSELVTRSTDPLVIEAVLGILADARLVTAGASEPGSEKVIEVAHEALIREWPTLRQWLDENREGLLLHRQLSEAAGHWQRDGRDPGGLLRGARLAKTGAWAQANPDSLNQVEQDLLDASLQAARDEQEQARQVQRARILRRYIYPALGAATLVLLAVLFFASGLNVRFKTPARMSGAFNIAVAEFGLRAADGRVTAAQNDAGARLSGWAADSLAAELGEEGSLLIWRDGPELRRQNVTIGRVAGSTAEERTRAAREMAKRLNAQMIIFGDIDTGQQPARLVLEFWMEPQAGYDYADLAGPYQVGQPVLLADAAQPGVEAQPEIERQAGALAWLALGLNRMYFGQAGEALDAFLRAGRFTPNSAAVQFFIGRESLFLASREGADRDGLASASADAFRRAAQIDPQESRAYIGLGSALFYQAENLFFDLPAGTSAEETRQALAPAHELLEQARAAYNTALQLPASAKPPGLPVDLTARQGIAITHLLEGQLRLAAGQAGDARAQFLTAAGMLEELLEPFAAGGHERYLAQVYQNLGQAHRLLAHLAVLSRDADQTLVEYARSAKYYDHCIQLGQSSTDQVVREDIAAQLCAPVRDELQHLIDALSGGS